MVVYKRFVLQSKTYFNIKMQYNVWQFNKAHKYIP